MIAFIDESGNTGHNFLDPQQPDFYTGALLARTDFDDEYGAEVLALAARVGVSGLHGAELGLYQLEEIACDLSRLLAGTDHSLLFGRAVKKDLVSLEFFDVVFDPTDNPAAPRIAYHSTPLRVALAQHFDLILNDEIRSKFWNAVNASRTDAAMFSFREACQSAIAQVALVKDPRAKELTEKSLRWASRYAEELTYFAREKHVKAQHYPNLALFPYVLTALLRQAEA